MFSNNSIPRPQEERTSLAIMGKPNEFFASGQTSSLAGRINVWGKL